tara:strand:+ start:1464 stop:3755 length:2292 start_codon:yes stop_codon:yes gene_type:complete
LSKTKSKKKRTPKKGNKAKKNITKRIFFFFLKSFLILGLLVLIFIASVNYGFFGHLYSEQEIKDFQNETASIIQSKEGKTIGKIFAENRTNVDYSDIPQHLIDALVATEDARFFEHNGIDTWSLMRVFFKTLLLNQNTGGGSTISQQLAKNMYGRKSFGPITMPVNKCKEAILAYRMESIYDKKEILALYLNTVPFGENVFGIQAAAQRYYNKDVGQLRLEESAVLVGILKANTYYNPRLKPENALSRRNTVLAQMNKYGYLKDAEFEKLSAKDLNLAYLNLQTQGPANYFIYQARKELDEILEDIEKKTGKKWDPIKDGLVIKTTLSKELQDHALLAFKKHLGKMQQELNRQYQRGSSSKTLDKMIKRRLKSLGLESKADLASKQEVFSWDGFYTDSISVYDSLKVDMTLLHAGLIGLDPNTGALRCYIGGIDFRTQPNDQIMAKRQLASTFKPILYSTALANGFEACDYLSNDSIYFPDYNNWAPKNYSGNFGGKYSFAASLANSLNIPTVNLFQELDFEKLDYQWKKMGFSSSLKNLPSTALGTANASVYELSIAYSAFANGGKKVEPYMIEEIKSADGEIIYQHKSRPEMEPILDDNIADQMNRILRKAILEGTGKAMTGSYSIKNQICGKTGTAQDFSDAWFACYTPKLVMVTRVGASSPAIHFNSGSLGSGGRLALPLVGLTLNYAQKDAKLKREIFQSFDFEDSSVVNSLNCPDFKEKNSLEKIIDIFDINNGEKRNSKKRSLLDRLLGRKKEELQ